jgi:hypothetical protein
MMEAVDRGSMADRVPQAHNRGSPATGPPAMRRTFPNTEEPTMDRTDTAADTRRGHHDLGGLALGPIDRSEHPRTLYEMRVDAMVMLLNSPACGIFGMDAMRRAIEAYAREEYETLPYYDRWMKAVRVLLVEQGVLTDAQIDARIERLRAARAAAPA